VYSAGYLEDADVEMLHREGVVGDVCTVFLRADGSYSDVAINARATGPTPDELHRVPRRVCVVAGDNKVAPLLAALRSGVVTDVVTDELTASRLLDVVSATSTGMPAGVPTSAERVRAGLDSGWEPGTGARRAQAARTPGARVNGAGYRSPRR
jgi:hypothetical protein